MLVAAAGEVNMALGLLLVMVVGAMEEGMLLVVMEQLI
jgi:hypothetical protein